MSLTPAGQVWSSITRYLSSFELVRLHGTGSRYLRSVLEKQGGVDTIIHEVHVPDEAKIDFPYLIDKALLWPRFLLVRFRLNLRTFHVRGVPTHAFIEADPPMNLVDFQVLPSTITSLVIPFHVRVTDEIVQTLPLDLVRLTLARDYSMPDRAMAAMPRSLIRFENATNPYFTNDVFCDLPPQLAQIELTASWKITSSCFRLLSHLRSLRLLNLARLETFSGQDLKFLPKGLEHLKLASITHMETEHIGYLPPALLTLELTSLQTISDEGIKMLPKSLTSLLLESVEGFTSHGVNQLPSRLTHLNINIRQQLEHIGISSLPKSLTHLTLEKASTVGSLKKRINLPNLTYLSLPLLSQFDDSNITYLPQAITVLNIRHCSKLTERALPLLPPQLAFLTLTAGSGFRKESWLALPDKLRNRLPMPLPYELLRGAAQGRIESELREVFESAKIPYEPMRHPVPRKSDKVIVEEEPTAEKASSAPLNLPRIRFDQWIQELITAKTLLVLPTQLEYLDLTLACNLNYPYFECLPRQLRELYLPLAPPACSREFVNLPPKLEVLYMGAPLYARLNRDPPTLASLLASGARPTYYPASVLPRAFNGFLSGSHYAHLPRGLKHLFILNWIHSVDADLAHLPPSLITFVAPLSNQYANGGHYYPRTIKYLDLSSSKLISDELVPTLPPQLTYLNLARAKLTNACIPNLPRSLTTFIAAKSNRFTDECIRALPPALTHLNMDYASSFTDSGLINLPSKLTHLSLRRSSLITDKAISKLPRSITILKFSHNSLLSPRCIPDLPPKLVRFETRFTVPYDAVITEFPLAQRKFNPNYWRRYHSAHGE